MIKGGVSPWGAVHAAESQFPKCEMEEGLSQHPICRSQAS